MKMMKRLILLCMTGLLLVGQPVVAQPGKTVKDTTTIVQPDSIAQDSTLTVTVDDEALLGACEDPDEQGGGFHKQL